jgi:hypothetical protein
MKTVIFSLALLLAGGISSFAQNTIDFVLVPSDTVATASVTAFTKNPVRARSTTPAKAIQLVLSPDRTLYFLDGKDSLSGSLCGIEQVIGLGSNWGAEGGPAVLIIKRQGYNPELLVLEVQKGKIIGAINFGRLPKSLMETDLNHLDILVKDNYKILLWDGSSSSEYFRLVLQGDRLEGYCMHM